MHNMVKISRKCGAEVGPTIQEADRFFLMDASARDQNDRSANGYVSGGERGERSGQTTSHEGMRVGQVELGRGRQHQEETGYKKPGWVPDRRKVANGFAQLQLQTLP